MDTAGNLVFGSVMSAIRATTAVNAAPLSASSASILICFGDAGSVDMSDAAAKVGKLLRQQAAIARSEVSPLI